MGAVVTRKQRMKQRQVNQATSKAILFGCHGMSCGDSAFDSSKMLTTPELVVSFNNDGISRVVTPLEENTLQGEIDQENESLSGETYSSGKAGFSMENMLFSSLRRTKNYFAGNTTSTGTSFEPTPLSQVLPQLYLGTEEDAQHSEKLIGLGITHIISIVGGGRYKDFYRKHMYIPLRDNGLSDLLGKLENSYDFAMESQESGNKLFVHCQLGMNRSASFVIGFLMKFKNLSLYEAYSLVKEKRQLIHPHKSYIEQLRQLDLKLHKVYSTPKNFLDIAVTSKEDIKIMHHNFSKAESEAFKRAQLVTICFLDSDDSPSSIRLPDFDYDQSISSRNRYQHYPSGFTSC